MFLLLASSVIAWVGFQRAETAVGVGEGETRGGEGQEKHEGRGFSQVMNTGWAGLWRCGMSRTPGLEGAVEQALLGGCGEGGGGHEANNAEDGREAHDDVKTGKELELSAKLDSVVKWKVLVD